MAVSVFPQTIQVMDGNTTFIAAPVLGASGAPATSYPSFGCRSLILKIKTTGTTFSLTFKIKQYNAITGAVSSLVTLDSAAKSAASEFTMTVSPGITAVTNVAVSDILSNAWQIEITGTSTDAKIHIVAELIP